MAGAPAFAATDDGAQPAESTHDANSLDENGAFSIGPTRRPHAGETVDPAELSSSPYAGSATFAFSDASNGTVSYVLDGIAQSKPITRQVFAAPATVCR